MLTIFVIVEEIAGTKRTMFKVGHSVSQEETATETEKQLVAALEEMLSGVFENAGAKISQEIVPFKAA